MPRKHVLKGRPVRIVPPHRRLAAGLVDGGTEGHGATGRVQDKDCERAGDWARLFELLLQEAWLKAESLLFDSAGKPFEDLDAVRTQGLDDRRQGLDSRRLLETKPLGHLLALSGEPKGRQNADREDPDEEDEW
jgi:hypothetical protein